MTREIFLKLLESDIKTDIYDGKLTEGDLEHIGDIMHDLIDLAFEDVLKEEGDESGTIR